MILLMLLATTMTSLSVAQNPFPQMMAAMAAGSRGPPPAVFPPLPAVNRYPQVRSSHCRYLINAPSSWGINASPFKLYTRSYAGEVRRGYPIEVSILPIYKVFRSFNFTDFAIWSEPLGGGGGPRPQPPRDLGMQWGGRGADMAPPAPSPNGVTHVGVWKVFPQYAGGASSLKCNIHSRGEDTVGSFEGRMLELLKSQFPGDSRLSNFPSTARQGVAFLWYPDENAMNSRAIKFIAKLKSFGQWFHLESTSWKVYVPPPPPRPFSFNMNANRMSTMVDRTVDMMQKLRQLERKLDRAGSAPA